MIDISIRKENADRAIAYFDGADARIYRGLVSRLGSEDAAQNAVILIGLIAKLGKLRTRKATEEIGRIHRLFPKLVGVSYKRFDSMLDDI
ncbi:MAG: hypothetical protein ACRECH_06425 [Nitrososphaerales archaeon]